MGPHLRSTAFGTEMPQAATLQAVASPGDEADKDHNEGKAVPPEKQW